ncbi:nuclear transport factor 2 family protein [Micromonospora sp. NPDC047548]|uniref:nuclear transport factor 2 family protein n=1 Tax=Micromonospora sp. NPDC047548 TaxID=3155624 RepID=UPI0033DEF903
MDTTPHEVFQRMQQQWLGLPAPLTGDDLAEDVIIEIPFAPPGHQGRFEGKQQFLDFANPQRAALPVRFDECRTIALHDTKDPNTIIIEYELTGTSTRTNQQSTAAFIGVLTVHDGKVTRWREYQNIMAILQALG